MKRDRSVATKECHDWEENTETKIYVYQILKEFVNITKDCTYKCNVCG